MSTTRQVGYRAAHARTDNDSPDPAPQPAAPGWPAGYRPLAAHLRADRLLTRGQVITIVLVGAAIAVVLAARLLGHAGPAVLTDAQAGLGLLTVVNSLIIAYKAFLVWRAGHYHAWQPSQEELRTMPPHGWPGINVIVPLWRERDDVVTALVRNLSALEYPQDRVWVKLAVEHDDVSTLRVLSAMPLPEHFRVVICPPRSPTSKPSACNHVLRRGCPGEITVIFDAEDVPDPLQLLMAAQAFAKAPPSVVCLQAQLQYHNAGVNRLTRLFASEYAAHFGLMLVGLTESGAPVPLGGTSNYFRTGALLQLGGWDDFNVTEDATLGYTIARRGWRVRMLDSVTYEEANSRIRNWLRQRSRWIKGYMQTWLVHMRHPVRLWRELGTRGFWSFQLVLGFTTFTTLVNPLLWGLTVTYVASRLAGWGGVTAGIEALFPPAIYYVGLASMVVGNLLVVYFHLAGCLERRLHEAVAALVLLPLYWLLMVVAAVMAILELARPGRRFSWAHTQHGLTTAPVNFAAAAAHEAVLLTEF